MRLSVPVARGAGMVLVVASPCSSSEPCSSVGSAAVLETGRGGGGGGGGRRRRGGGGGENALQL